MKEKPVGVSLSESMTSTSFSTPVVPGPESEDEEVLLVFDPEPDTERHFCFRCLADLSQILAALF